MSQLAKAIITFKYKICVVLTANNLTVFDKKTKKQTKKQHSTPSKSYKIINLNSNLILNGPGVFSTETKSDIYVV